MARPRSDIQPRIVHAARDCFLKQGVDGASLRGIARDAGTNIGMVYYYYPTKDDLFLAVVEEVYEQLLEDLSSCLSVEEPTRERILRMYQRISAMTEVEYKVVLLVVRESLTSTARLERLIERFKRGHIVLLTGGLAEGVAAGDINGDLHPALLVWSTLGLGLVPQLAMRVAGERLPWTGLPEGEELIRGLVDVLFEGIGSKQHSEPRP